MIRIMDKVMVTFKVIVRVRVNEQFRTTLRNRPPGR